MNNKINKQNTAGIYIHIPFCLSKCEYCDFVSFVSQKEKPEYLSALLCDIKQKAKKYPLGDIDTIYFGGGTPSILNTSEIAEILACIKDSFSVKADCEITLEVNPKTATREKLLSLKELGINRISVGVQSFSNSELSAVARAHTGEEAKEILQMVGEIFSNFSCDLMLGLPTSTMASVEKSLKTAIAFCPQHISLYALQVEEGTPLAQKVQSGTITIPTEDTATDMFELAEKNLKEAGFVHYEISNFAKKGYESRHNLGYWKLKDYLGFGVSSHSLVGLERFYAPNSIKEYIALVSKNQCELPEETLSVADAKSEYTMLSFRLETGINLQEYQQMFASNFQKYHESQIKKLEKYLTITPTNISIKEQYFYISNQIISEFI